MKTILLSLYIYSILLLFFNLIQNFIEFTILFEVNMSTTSTIIDLTRYTLASKIGEGSFSKVYRIRDIKTLNYYAAKIFKFMIDD